MRFVWTPILIVLSLTGILGFFQNCTPAVPFGNTDYFQALVNSPIFPYELGVDQVAYMSCAEQEDIYNDGTFFTFRVGSYNSHGVRLSQEYRDNIKKVANDDVPWALSQAQASANSRIFLSARPIDNLQLMFRDEDNGEEGLSGYDHDIFFPPLGNEDLNTILWNMLPQEYLRTFAPGRTIDDYRFQGELKFMKSERMEMDLRSFFSGNGLLTVTFAQNGDVFPIGPGSLIELQTLANNGQLGNVSLPAPGSVDSGSSGRGLVGTDGSLGGDQVGNVGTGSGGSGTGSNSSQKVSSADFSSASNNLATNVFGVGLKPRFKQPLSGGSGPDMPPRVLSSIQDIVIDSRLRNQINERWDCPEDLQFMIVLPEHAVYQDVNSNTITRCGTDPDPIGFGGDNNLEIARQSILSEDFYIDMVRKCVVPKPDHTVPGSCYGKDSNTQNTYIINYDSFADDGCGFDNVNGLCPHFVSVCHRVSN